MGGSALDTTIRMCFTLLTLLLLVVFLCLDIFIRPSLNLPKCYVSHDSESPTSPDFNESEDISEQWRLLYYFSIAAQVLAILQISAATYRFQKVKNTPRADAIALTLTILNIIAQTVNFIWLHIARFSHTGRVCSGDYLDQPEYDDCIKNTQQNSYLIWQGLFLKVILIVMWTTFSITLCCGSLCLCCLHKLTPNVN